jgi:hypothetical protein
LLPSGQTALWALTKTDPWCRWADRFCTPLLSPEPARRIIYPEIVTAFRTPYRTITTNCLIPVTTPLTTTVLGDVAVPLFIIPKGHPPSSIAYIIVHSNERPTIQFCSPPEPL